MAHSQARVRARNAEADISLLHDTALRSLEEGPHDTRLAHVLSECWDRKYGKHQETSRHMMDQGIAVLCL